MRRFWSKVDVRGPAECWDWQAALFTNGYGAFRFMARQVKAHRMAYELMCGPIPKGLQVNHHCDDKRCVNPAHLYVGDQKQNRQDAVIRGRTAKGLQNGMHTHPESRPRGENNGNHKLSDQQRADMRAAYAKGDVSMSQLGRQYGITKPSVAYVVGRVEA
jgi:hypothetical protein